MKRRVGILAGAVLLLLMGLVWRDGWRDGAPANSPIQHAAAPTALSQAASPASAPAPPVQAIASTPKRAVRTAASEPPVEPVWDLCGIGRLPRPPGAMRNSGLSAFEDLPPHLGAEPLAAAMGKLLDALDAGDARWQAAAVVLRGTDAAGREAIPALSTLAASSKDPVVARWLAARCSPSGKRCTLADIQRWPEAEPGNLAAWLNLVDHQPERRAEIVARAGTLQRFDMHLNDLTDTVLRAMPSDVLPYVQVQLWVHAIGVEAAFGISSIKVLFDACRPAPAPGSERQQACAATAGLLLDHSDSLLARGMGLRLAELGGTPKAQTDAWRAEMLSMRQKLDAFYDVQPFACAPHAQTKAWLQLRARLGEWGALQAMHEATQAAASAARPR